MKFTPGPWKIVGTTPLGKMGAEVIATGDGQPALVIAYKHYKEWRANARLISKAPEMYEMLKILESKIPSVDEYDEVAHEWIDIGRLLTEIDGPEE